MTIPNSLRVYSSKTGYLYVPYHEDLNFGAEDFTIEFWAKFNSWNNGRGLLTKGWASFNVGSFLIYTEGNSTITFYASADGSSWNIASSQPIGYNIEINKWYHISVTRASGVYRTFLNGTLTASWSNGSAFYNHTSQGLTIGNGQYGGQPSDCLIDGLRLTKGVARYTSNFTPSTADPKAQGLLVDKSKNTKPVVNYGSVSTNSSNSHFSNASAYFNGSSYLSVPGSEEWKFNTDDFTIEAWVNPEVLTNTRSIVGNYNGSDGGWRLAIDSTLSPIYGEPVTFTATNYGTEVDVIIPGVLEITRNNQQGIYNSAVEGGYSRYVSPTNTGWNRSGWTNICNYASRSYVDWLSAADNGRYPPSYVNSEAIMKHVPTNRYWLIKFTNWQSGNQGGGFSYIRKEILGCQVDSSIIQFRNGNDTIVTRKIVPPLPTNDWYHLAVSKDNDNLRFFLDGNELQDSVPDANYSNVTLLLHMNGSNGSTSFIDSSNSPKTITAYGNAQISTTQSKFNGSSAYFDGNGDYVTLPPSSDWDFGAGDFTIEFWAYLLSHGGGGYNHYFSVINQNTFGFKSYSDFYYLYANGAAQVQTSTAPVLNSWQHIALVRNGTSLKIFVNGVESGSSTINSEISYGSSSGSAYIGSGWSGEFLHGYIDELRITKGIARYTENFTPANAAFFPNPIPFTANINSSNLNGLTIGATKFSNGAVYDVYKGHIDDLRVTKGVSRYNFNFPKPAAPVAVLGTGFSVPSAVSGVGLNERDNILKVYGGSPVLDGGSVLTSYGVQYSTDSGASWSDATVNTDPYYGKVSLLLPMNGPNNSFDFYDDSKYNKTILAYNDSKITTSQSKFGGSSGSFDGNDYLVVSNSASDNSFNLKDTDWTIEAWIRPTGNWSKYNTIVGKRGAGGSDGTGADFYLYLRQSSGALSFYSDLIGGIESGATPIPNMWNHVAAVRKNNTISLYLNGVRVLRFTGNTAYTTNRTLYIGGWPTGDEYFFGHINDVRITKGIARYDGDFNALTMTQAPANRISNLTPATSYIFRARAQNVVGGGPYSSDTTVPLSTLGAVTNLSVIPDDSVAYLSWTPPVVTNSAIQDYSIQYSSDNGDTWNSFSHSASKNSSIVVTGLNNSTNYIFRVAAINFAGTGTYSSNSSSVTVAQRLDNTYNKTRLLLHLDTNT